jgi:3D (Asp-Asp-Asp) domain-containing protein
MVQNKAPKMHPETKEDKTRLWVKSFLSQDAGHRRWKSLPFFWTVAVCAVVFPIGLWNGFDVASLANPAPVGITAKKILPGTSSQLIDSSDAATMTFHLVDANRPSDFAITVPEGQKCTVADALTASDVALNKYDRVTPDLDAAVTSGMTVTVTRVSVGYHKRYVTYKPETRYQLTTSLSPGEKKVQQDQRTGTEEITERVWMKNGKITLKEITDRKVVRHKQDKVILLGVSHALAPGKIPYHSRYARSFSLSARGGSPRQRMQNAAKADTLRPLRSITLHSTAYSNSPWENGGSTRTATGMPVVYGVAAVDPRVIPLGTKLYVEGYGYAFACDTGSAIKGHRIDLAMPLSRTGAWGRRTVRAWILGP